MSIVKGCTCPNCRKGYIPSNYTFGGNCPPSPPKPMTTSDEKLRATIRYYKKWRHEIDAALGNKGDGE